MLHLDTASSGPRPEGARDGLVAGCYLHGLFATDGFRRAFVKNLGGAADADFAYEAHVEATLDALAAHLERHLDIASLLDIAHAR
jgi:adenosylcobyric acid synthase